MLYFHAPREKSLPKSGTFEHSVDFISQCLFGDGFNIDINIFGIPNAFEKKAEIASSLHGIQPLIELFAHMAQEKKVKKLNRLLGSIHIYNNTRS
jgi:hypothetical protein